MIATKIPYLYTRNGIYYYRHQSTWLSLKTRSKQIAFQKLCLIISGTCEHSHSKLHSFESSAAVASPIKIIPEYLSTTPLIDSYFNENAHRWAPKEEQRVLSTLKHLPKRIYLNATRSKEEAINLKKALLKDKSVTAFNRYLKYFNSFYNWLISNNTDITNNPFNGMKIKEKTKPINDQRLAYTPEQMKELMKLATKFGKDNPRYWLILIARYTGARLNEICQLKPDDITDTVIKIRGEKLKTANALRYIPLHPRLIELGILNWVSKLKDTDPNERLMSVWAPIKGSYSHGASRWFGRNKPFANLDFHSIRHTVATELKSSGVPSQYAAQILGHNNGNITYDRYGKDIDHSVLTKIVNKIG